MALQKAGNILTSWATVSLSRSYSSE